MLPIFPDLHRSPDAVFILAGELAHLDAAQAQTPSTASHSIWDGTGGAAGVRVELTPAEHGTVTVSIAADGSALGEFSAQNGGVPVARVFLRWQHHFPAGFRFLGDAWERSYGELEWRGASPHRLMPWSFLANHGNATAGYGVLIGAAAIACWTVDREGVTLELDVRAGGVGVRLGQRRLLAATLLQHQPQTGETPYNATRQFCRALASGGAPVSNLANHTFPPRSLCPAAPVVGHNDWYWLYGKNSARQILEATERFLELCPDSRRREREFLPWSVIDDGWQAPDTAPQPGCYPCNGGPWDETGPLFPDMPGLAASIREMGARPGIWMRPLLTKKRPPESWLLQRGKLPTLPVLPNGGVGFTLDPTVPDVLELVRADIARLRGWGFELIKHDFSTYDITGRWGFEMTAAPDRFAPDGWRFSRSDRTSAEVISQLYTAIRKAAGTPRLAEKAGAGADANPVTLIGCNTVGHLAAGLVEIQRIGDDTSASDWDRTRRMGVNTLAFRAAQHGAFFAADADCVPVTPHVPWRLTQNWLDLVARSGTPLFLSIDPKACGEVERAALKEALVRAFQPGTAVAEPQDWLETPIPLQWHAQRQTTRFQWSEWDGPQQGG